MNVSRTCCATQCTRPLILFQTFYCDPAHVGLMTAFDPTILYMYTCPLSTKWNYIVTMIVSSKLFYETPNLVFGTLCMTTIQQLWIVVTFRIWFILLKASFSWTHVHNWFLRDLGWIHSWPEEVSVSYRKLASSNINRILKLTIIHIFWYMPEPVTTRNRFPVRFLDSLMVLMCMTDVITTQKLYISYSLLQILFHLTVSYSCNTALHKHGTNLYTSEYLNIDIQHILYQHKYNITSRYNINLDCSMYNLIAGPCNYIHDLRVTTAGNNRAIYNLFHIHGSC